MARNPSPPAEVDEKWTAILSDDIAAVLEAEAVVDERWEHIKHHVGEAFDEGMLGGRLVKIFKAQGRERSGSWMYQTKAKYQKQG